MKEEDKFTIHVSINGLKIPLNIPRRDEEIYRKAEHLLETYIEKYRSTYAQHSMEEVLIMVGYQLSVLTVRLDENQSISPLAEKIEELNTILKSRAEKEE